MQALRDAYADVRAGRAVSIVVRGESGIGKSCLVRRFAEERVARGREIVVLAGRCYEREAVSYKAFDGVVDALSRFLSRLTDDEVRPLLPLRPGPLVQVFPILRRVEAIARAQIPTSMRLDPLELRSRASSARCASCSFASRAEGRSS